MGQPVVHFEIGGKDASKLREFYGNLFEWGITVHDELGGYATVDREEGGIGGGIMQSTGEMPPSFVTFYVQVDDLQEYLDKVEELGGQTTMAPMEIGPEIGSAAMFTDPNGNCIGLYKPA